MTPLPFKLDLLLNNDQVNRESTEEYVEPHQSTLEHLTSAFVGYQMLCCFYYTPESFAHEGLAGGFIQLTCI